MVSAETLRVRIEAEDGASATLMRIGERAAELERALERLEGRGAAIDRPPTGSAAQAGGAMQGSGAQATIAVRVEDRAAAALAAVSAALGAVDGRMVTVRVEAETAEAGRQIGAVSARHAELDGRGAVVRVDAETAGASAGLASVAAIRVGLDGATATVETSAETEGADAALAGTIQLHAALDGRTATARVAVEGAEAMAGALKDLGDAAGDRTVTVAVSADTAAARAELAAAAAQHGEMNGVTATLRVGADTVAAMGAMAGARMAHLALNGVTATLRVGVDTGEARAGIAWAAGYAGRVLATSYIDIVTRRSTVGIGPTARHGGVPRRAHGGVVLAEMHEAGPEVLHGPGGERAVTGGRGVYAVRSGTYVSPAPASRGLGDGVAVGDIHVYGNVYGMEDLAERVTRELAPAISEELHRYRTAMGMAGG